VVLLSLLLAAALPSPQVAFVRSGTLKVAYVNAGIVRPIVERVQTAPVGFSGNGRALSAGGRIPGIPPLPTSALAWAPEGETAAYQTRDGAVWVWSPGRQRRILSASWGATSLAWGPGGRLALGRSVCHAPCGIPAHQEVWVWRAGRLTRVAGPLHGVQRPVVRGFARRGRVLWWSDLEGSASIAADGLPLYANSTRIATTLPYADFVATCAAGVVLSAGTDRYTMHGKRLLLNGSDLSRDPTRSWVEPDCRGSTIVAAASRNTVPDRIGDEHRAIWELAPGRRQLTDPPAGASDDSPRILSDGSIVFVRTRRLATRLNLYGRGELMLLRDGALTALADVGRTPDYYGHYDWYRQIAVWP
jgi:hypothetical protein